MQLGENKMIKPKGKRPVVCKIGAASRFSTTIGGHWGLDGHSLPKKIIV
jgi:hypothetical protein